MEKDRLLAFSDGVIAIIITLTAFEIKAPLGADWVDLYTVLPAMLIYGLSFLYVAIYWNNHHHMLHLVRHVNGKILWANLHLLFWLSLVPFATSWLGKHPFTILPTALYGVNLLMAAVAYYILERTLIASQGKDGAVHRALGRDNKEILSMLLYITAVVSAFYCAYISTVLHVIVALLWIIPDRRVEKILQQL